MDCRHCLQETKYELSLFPFMFVAILQVLTYIYVSLYQCVRIIPLSIFHAVHGSFDKKYLRQYLRWHLNLAQQLTYAWHTWSCPFRWRTINIKLATTAGLFFSFFTITWPWLWKHLYGLISLFFCFPPPFWQRDCLNMCPEHDEHMDTALQVDQHWTLTYFAPRLAVKGLTWTTPGVPLIIKLLTLWKVSLCLVMTIRTSAGLLVE